MKTLNIKNLKKLPVEERKAAIEQYLSTHPNPPPSVLDSLSTLLTEIKDSDSSLSLSIDDPSHGQYLHPTASPAHYYTSPKIDPVPLSFNEGFRDSISSWRATIATAEAEGNPSKAAAARHHLIEARKDLHTAYHLTTPRVNQSQTSTSPLRSLSSLEGVSLTDSAAIAALLKLPPKSDFSDLWALQLELRQALPTLPPFLSTLVHLKSEGRTSSEIASYLSSHFDCTDFPLSPSHLSSLYCRTVPKLLAHHFTSRYYHSIASRYSLPYRTCRQCGQALPELPFFFSFDSKRRRYYSICRQCRRKPKIWPTPLSTLSDSCGLAASLSGKEKHGTKN